jgi:hypothetical protein
MDAAKHRNATADFNLIIVFGFPFCRVKPVTLESDSGEQLLLNDEGSIKCDKHED